MKKIFLLAIPALLFASCTKQSNSLPLPSSLEQRTAHVEIHVVILSEKGEKKFNDSSFTFHLSQNYKTNGTDSATIVRQLIHVNQVLNHGAAKDLVSYPYTKYDLPSNNGNIISENPVSIENLVDTTGVKNWVTQICDHGFAPHTHIESNTQNTILKIIYPNL